jgi:4-amino-4-deoxy-L-arabinose transferase-like glycosyltransferase
MNVNVIFYTGLISGLISIYFHVIKRNKLSLFFLFCTSLFLLCFASSLYPFLNVWDERFHALVAKNMLDHPLMPTLYNETPVDIAYDWWDRSHIWLHKQPLFLWQIALSFKLFGVNETALRLPMIILGSFTVYAVYRSGKIIGNKDIGYYAALLFSTCFYGFELVSGRQETDHNDFSFVAYISLSLWAWIEYENKQNKWWLLLIGVFAGFAILCKWLPGLLVYLGWGAVSIARNKTNLWKWKDLLFSLSITLLIVLPWQLLIFNWYPVEASESYQYNMDHFSIPIEGHKGPFTYHLELIGRHYGSLVPIIFIPAIGFMFLGSKNNRLILGLTINILFVFIFYSVVATKMPSFTFILALPAFICVAFFMDVGIRLVCQKIKGTAWAGVFLFVFLAALFFTRLNLPALREKHRFKNDPDFYHTLLGHNKRVFTNLNLQKNTILFNVKGRHYIEAMFYSGLTAYNFMPSKEQYADLKSQGRNIAIFKSFNDTIPEYLSNDPTVIQLKDTLNLCE